MISVVIPVYNVEKFIEEAINSVLAQCCDDIEMLIVDDCSNDSSIDVALSQFNKSTYSSDVRIIRHEENRGLSAARNTGIAEAKGDWLFFFDSDDVLADDCIKNLMHETENHPDADVIVGQYDEFEDEEQYHSARLKQQYGVCVGDVIGAYMNGRIPTTAWNKLVRKDFLIENNLFFEEGLVHEDALWSFQVACMAKKIVVADTVTYHYRQRQGSLDKQKNEALHFTHYNRVYCLQSKYVFDHSLQVDKRVFRFIEKNRYQLLTDASMFDPQLGYDLYKASRSYPYWMQLHRLMPVWAGYIMYIRLRCLWLKLRQM